MQQPEEGIIAVGKIEEEVATAETEKRVDPIDHKVQIISSSRRRPQARPLYR